MNANHKHDKQRQLRDDDGADLPAVAVALARLEPRCPG